MGNAITEKHFGFTPTHAPLPLCRMWEQAFGWMDWEWHGAGGIDRRGTGETSPGAPVREEEEEEKIPRAAWAQWGLLGSEHRVRGENSSKTQ